MEDTQHIASARGNNIGISRKFAVEVAGFLRGKNLADAKKKMEDVIALKVAVPFKRYHMDLGHKRGPMGPGRFPEILPLQLLQEIALVPQERTNGTRAISCKSCKGSIALIE